MDRFASCAKSAVSIQEQICHKQGCIQLKRRWHQFFQAYNAEQNSLKNQEQLISEIYRLKRKLQITQKSKHLLSDQLNLVKQQLQIAKNRLKNLKQPKNEHQQIAISLISYCGEKTNRIVIKQRQQQINMLLVTLKEKKRQIQYFKTQNIQLVDQINSKNSILSKMQESNCSQIEYYRREISHLQQNLQSKSKEINDKQKLYAKTIEKQRQEMNKVKKTMQIKVIQKQQQIQKLLEKEKKLWQIISNFQQKVKVLEYNSKSQIQENIWLKKVIQQVKIEFTHNQLIKLEQKDKKKKESQDIKKRKIISQVSKDFKLQTTMISTRLPSTKTHRISNQSPDSCIPLFLLPPQDLNLSQIESSFDKSKLNQC